MWRVRAFPFPQLLKGKMKSIGITTCCILSIIAAGAIICSAHYSGVANANQRLVKQLQSEASASAQANAAKTEGDAEAIASLQNRLARASLDLTNTFSDLLAANDKLKNYVLTESNRMAEAGERAFIPPPTVFGEGLNKVYVFQKIVGIKGDTLATNAAFAQQVGRLFVFRPEGKSALSIDVDALHPLILKYLGVDATSAKAKQAQMNSAWSSKSQSDQAASAVVAQQWVDRRAAQVQYELDKQKADATSQAAAAAQAQAQADKEKADAAMIAAQKPPPQINIIQQQQQNQNSQSHAGYYLLNGVWYPY